jgi:CrcB protein
MQWLAIALGGAVGAMARFGVSTWAHEHFDHRYPIGTLLVNVVGSFFMGIFYVLIIERGLLPAEWRPLIMTGFLGAFTTFSTYSLDALSLWQAGNVGLALGYILMSVVSCLLAVWLAVTLAQRLV